MWSEYMLTQSERLNPHNHYRLAGLIALTKPDVALRCSLQELDTEVKTCKVLSQLCAVHAQNTLRQQEKVVTPFLRALLLLLLLVPPRGSGSGSRCSQHPQRDPPPVDKQKSHSHACYHHHTNTGTGQAVLSENELSASRAS